MRPKKRAVIDVSAPQAEIAPWVPGAPLWAPGAPELIGPPHPPKLSAPSYDGPPRALIQLMQARIGYPSGVTSKVFDIWDLFGKREKTQGQKNMAKLKDARKKVQELAKTVRSDAFDDWIATCVVKSTEPKEWTRATPLYESFARHFLKYGWNRGDKAVAKEELPTDTAWGKLMADGGFIKKRRSRPNGNFYPLRLKQGA